MYKINRMERIELSRSVLQLSLILLFASSFINAGTLENLKVKCLILK